MPFWHVLLAWQPVPRLVQSPSSTLHTATKSSVLQPTEPSSDLVCMVAQPHFGYSASQMASLALNASTPQVEMPRATFVPQQLI